MKRIRTISLFCGCGGSDLALHDLGFEIVWANDISEIACATYRDNLSSVAEHGNITDFNMFPSAELLVGCYPCQGFTQGGKRDAKDSINYLYQELTASCAQSHRKLLWSRTSMAWRMEPIGSCLTISSGDTGLRVTVLSGEC